MLNVEEVPEIQKPTWEKTNVLFYTREVLSEWTSHRRYLARHGHFFITLIKPNLRFLDCFMILNFSWVLAGFERAWFAPENEEKNSLALEIGL